MPFLAKSVNGFWRHSPSTGETLCISILNQGRDPCFYEKWGIPDTLEGRFDCAILHLCLFLRHVKGPLAQIVFDTFFSYTDLTLREVGVSDLKVGNQVKKCAKFFYGASKAYSAALEGRASLQEALERNLYGRTSCSRIEEVEAYVREADNSLKEQCLSQNPLQNIRWPMVG